MDGLRRSHAELHHVEKLFGIVTMRINASVSTEGHFGSGFDGFLEVFPLHAAHHFFFLYIFFRQSELNGFAENVIVVVDVHVQICAMILGQADSFVVNQAGVFD